MSDPACDHKAAASFSMSRDCGLLSALADAPPLQLACEMHHIASKNNKIRRATSERRDHLFYLYSDASLLES